MRKHIAEALQKRSAAVCTALDQYNTAAKALQPPHTTLKWEDIIEYAFLLRVPNLLGLVLLTGSFSHFFVRRHAMFEYCGTAELLCVRQLFLIVRTDFVVYISKLMQNLNINGNCLLYLALPHLSSSYATPMFKHIYMYVCDG